MRIHCLQHVTFETPGAMLTWAARHGHHWTYTHLHEPAPQFPALSDFDWLLVLGGAMGVHDDAQFGWLPAEKEFIRLAIEAGKTVLGICLGAQLLAQALGARVYRSEVLEIGFWPVEPLTAAGTQPLFTHFTQPLTVLHWHGDTFELPAGAAAIASSKGCALQAFSWQNRVVGLQFHPEVTAGILRPMLLHDGHELVPGPWVQPAAELERRLPELAAGHGFLFHLLDQLALQTGPVN